MMRNFLLMLFSLLAFTACHEGEDPDYYKKKNKEQIDRTVLVYISGENNLHEFISEELSQLRKGSIGIGSNALVVYVDNANAQQPPYIVRYKEGEAVDYTAMEKDTLSSSPDVLSDVLNYTSEHYTAKEYGLVLWGHASGWLLEDSVSAADSRRAYGVDNGHNTLSSTGKWLNIHSLSKTLGKWQHLKFIFADCCQFQCIESAYELRNNADYIIASPSEIPGVGAPYSTLTKGLFDSSDSFYRSIVDAYFSQVISVNYQSFAMMSYQARTPFSVIKTSELDKLAAATNTVLHSFLPLGDAPWPDLQNEKLIYYYGNISKVKENLMYDMNDVILNYAPTEAYEQWKEAFDKAIIYKVNAKEGWMTNKQILPYVFGRDNAGGIISPILTDERFGGVSMFVPQDRPDSHYLPFVKNNVKHNGYNADIKQTAWYYAARLYELGW